LCTKVDDDPEGAKAVADWERSAMIAVDVMVVFMAMVIFGRKWI